MFIYLKKLKSTYLSHKRKDNKINQMKSQKIIEITLISS